MGSLSVCSSIDNKLYAVIATYSYVHMYLSVYFHRKGSGTQPVCVWDICFTLNEIPWATSGWSQFIGQSNSANWPWNPFQCLFSSSCGGVCICITSTFNPSNQTSARTLSSHRKHTLLHDSHCKSRFYLRLIVPNHNTSEYTQTCSHTQTNTFLPITNCTFKDGGQGFMQFKAQTLHTLWESLAILQQIKV